MINRIQLLRNVGLFDSVRPATNVHLARLTLIYAENGRGKTTLAAILRSLATGDAIPIAERRRLAAQNPPHVVLDCIGGPPDAMFQNNAWNRLPDTWHLTPVLPSPQSPLSPFIIHHSEFTIPQRPCSSAS